MAAARLCSRFALGPHGGFLFGIQRTRRMKMTRTTTKKTSRRPKCRLHPDRRPGRWRVTGETSLLPLPSRPVFLPSISSPTRRRRKMSMGLWCVTGEGEGGGGGVGMGKKYGVGFPPRTGGGGEANAKKTEKKIHPHIDPARRRRLRKMRLLLLLCPHRVGVRKHSPPSFQRPRKPSRIAFLSHFRLTRPHRSLPIPQKKKTHRRGVRWNSREERPMPLSCVMVLLLLLCLFFRPGRPSPRVGCVLSPPFRYRVGQPQKRRRRQWDGVVWGRGSPPIILPNKRRKNKRTRVVLGAPPPPLSLGPPPPPRHRWTDAFPRYKSLFHSSMRFTTLLWPMKAFSSPLPPPPPRHRCSNGRHWRVSAGWCGDSSASPRGKRSGGHPPRRILLIGGGGACRMLLLPLRSIARVKRRRRRRRGCMNTVVHDPHRGGRQVGRTPPNSPRAVWQRHHRPARPPPPPPPPSRRCLLLCGC